MYQNKTNRIDDRIVSLTQPHVRPIVRGKAGKATDFGAKLSASSCDGYRVKKVIVAFFASIFITSNSSGTEDYQKLCFGIEFKRKT
jgi:hypothetical protein